MPLMTMEERVARAESMLERVSWAIREAIAEDRDPARAAIEAMREPDEAMLAAMQKAKNWFDGEGWSQMPSIVRQGYDAMIDAALNPSHAEGR